MPTFALERKTGGPVAGIDEVGRGTLAGPVCAAAVILNPRKLPKGVDDSKALKEGARERLYNEIMRKALAVGVGMASVEEIDELNILQATMLAMRRAVTALPLGPVLALVDGNRVPIGLPCPAQPIIKGDAKVLSIAAASIIAKVTRDRLMGELDLACPGYNWARNKGYGTADHLEALSRLGATPYHRSSFAPVAEVMRKAAS